MLKTLILTGACLGAFALTDSLPDPNGDAPRPSARAAQEFEIDPTHSSVLFRIDHLQAARFWGRFNAIEGGFRFDPEAPDESFVRITIPVDGVDTGNENRDRHLKSQDFFSAVEFPDITFESTKIERVGEDAYRVTGDLTIRGQTKEITAGAQHTGTADVNPRFGLRSGYEATFEIDRTEFGVSWGAENDMLGRVVRIVIALEGKLPG